MPGLITSPGLNQQGEGGARDQDGGFSSQFLYSLVSEQDRNFMHNVIQLQIGDRFQVLWRIEVLSEDQEQTVSSGFRWWGCKLLGPAFIEGTQPSSSTLLKDPQQRQVWKILYDEEEGFDPEIRTVSFTEHIGELFDMQEGGILEWRLEGDHSSSSEDEEGGSYEMAEDELVDLRQFADGFSNDLVAQMEQEAMSQMQNLPADQQLRIASAMREFIDHVVDGVAEVTEQGNSVVTQQHIQDIMRRFRRPQ
eukprot:TRINITY_DN2757_c0_g2_i1.p1 TRINITY_DN2757_c0_g2~~TRINITY_DN2757_c0_g2_i1.p1  ORF type:complete len:266 (-),score=43.10 TRINITY_DN2757_c0_g2_i1:440-1189(-)